MVNLVDLFLRRRLALWLVLLLLGLSGQAAQAAQRLRLNPSPGLVHHPGRSQGYGLAVAETDLYVAWLERQAFGVQVLLSRVDLNDFSVQETLQVSQGKGATSKGGRIFPDVLELQGEIYLSWLDRGQRQRRPWHSINLISLSELRQGGKPHVFEFGKYMGHPRLVGTSQGPFLLGFSQNLGESDWRIRLYRKSGKGWAAVEQLNQDSFKGRDPLLIDDSEGLSLFWVWGTRIFRSRSADGESWSQPQVLVEQEKRIHSLQVVSFQQDLDLAWVEQEWEQADVWVQRIDASNRGEPQAVARFTGRNVEIFLSREKNSGQRVIAYSYNGAEEGGKVIGAASEGEGWAVRALTALEPRFAGSPVPLVYQGAGGLYFAWSFYPRATQMPRPESLFVAALDGAGLGKAQPRSIGRRELQSVDSAPKLWQFRDELYVSYFSSQVILGGTVLARGDLYLEKVELLREASGE